MINYKTVATPRSSSPDIQPADPIVTPLPTPPMTGTPTSDTTQHLGTREDSLPSTPPEQDPPPRPPFWKRVCNNTVIPAPSVEYTTTMDKLPDSAKRALTILRNLPRKTQDSDNLYPRLTYTRDAQPTPGRGAKLCLADVKEWLALPPGTQLDTKNVISILQVAAVAALITQTTNSTDIAEIFNSATPEIKKALFNYKSPSGETLFHYAAQNTETAGLVTALVVEAKKLGLDTEALINQRQTALAATPLHIAAATRRNTVTIAEQRRDPVVTELLTHGALPHLKTGFGHTPAQMATRASKHSLTAFDTERKSNTSNSLQAIIRKYNLIENQSIFRVRLLFRYNPDTTQTQSKSLQVTKQHIIEVLTHPHPNTPLEMKFLLLGLAIANASNPADITEIVAALPQADQKVLLSRSDNSGYTLFHYAALNTQTPNMVGILADCATTAGVNTAPLIAAKTTGTQWTPLRLAVSSNYLVTDKDTPTHPVVEHFLRLGADGEAIDLFKNSAVTWAATYNRTHALHSLLEARANPSTQNEDHKTPLQSVLLMERWKAPIKGYASSPRATDGQANRDIATEKLIYCVEQLLLHGATMTPAEFETLITDNEAHINDPLFQQLLAVMVNTCPNLTYKELHIPVSTRHVVSDIYTQLGKQASYVCDITVLPSSSASLAGTPDPNISGTQAPTHESTV